MPRVFRLHSLDFLVVRATGDRSKDKDKHDDDPERPALV